MQVIVQGQPLEVELPLLCSIPQGHDTADTKSGVQSGANSGAKPGAKSPIPTVSDKRHRPKGLRLSCIDDTARTRCRSSAPTLISNSSKSCLAGQTSVVDGCFASRLWTARAPVDRNCLLTHAVLQPCRSPVHSETRSQLLHFSLPLLCHLQNETSLSRR